MCVVTVWCHQIRLFISLLYTQTQQETSQSVSQSVSQSKRFINSFNKRWLNSSRNPLDDLNLSSLVARPVELAVGAAPSENHRTARTDHLNQAVGGLSKARDVITPPKFTEDVSHSVCCGYPRHTSHQADAINTLYSFNTFVLFNDAILIILCVRKRPQTTLTWTADQKNEWK